MDNLQINEPVNLKSPIFKPKPGWGGQLGGWIKNNFVSKVLPILVIAGIATGAYIYSCLKKPASIIQEWPTTISKTIQPDQSLTSVVRMTIVEYLNKNSLDLSAEQKLYLETYLVSQLGKTKLVAGDSITLSTKDLDEAIEKAKALTPTQIKAWARYLK